MAEPLLLNIKQTLEFIGGGISSRTLYRLLEADKFPRPVKLGRGTFFKRVDLVRFINDADGNLAKFNRIRRGDA